MDFDRKHCPEVSFLSFEKIISYMSVVFYLLCSKLQVGLLAVCVEGHVMVFGITSCI